MAEYIYRAEPIGEGEYSHTLVGELVRCGECKYYSLTFECMKDECGIEEPPTWYCADGERRGEIYERYIRT